MLYSIVGILVIILDQAVKFWVSDTLFGTDVVRFIPGVISLVNVHNDGAAFSFLSGSGARIYFIIATGIFTLLVIIALATNFIRGKFARWCLVLVAAGGLGNMIDRVIYGYVQDMFKVELFNFAIFNVADVFITVFAILFALAMIFERPESDLNDVLYENDPEDERPAKEKKAPRKGLLARRKALAEAEQAEAGETAEEPQPEKNPVRAARKSRQEKYEQEYEEYKAQQRAAMAKRKKAAAPAAEELPTPAPKPAPAAKPAANTGADPYDAWVQANARAEAQKGDSYAGRVMDVPKSSAKPTAPARPAAARPAPAPAPAAPAEAPKAPAPAPKPAAEEYSLDDILAEFK